MQDQRNVWPIRSSKTLSICLWHLQNAIELRIVFRAELQGAKIVASSEFDSRRLAFQVKNGEIKMCLGKFLIKVDRFAHFVLSALQPTPFANQDTQVEMSFWVARIEIDGLG